MTLTDPQRAALTEWVASGLKLSEIQKRLNSDFDLNLTYMEVRFLVDDCKLTLKDAERTKDASEALAAAAPAPAPSNAPSPLLGGNTGLPQTPPQPAAAPETPAAPTGGVALTVDQVTRPGTLVSGNVRFSDGQTATWYLDQMGRLGLAPSQKGYRPPQEDIEEFQLALERELARLGM